jgi:predicted nucleotidyltransferase component of viral defense system
MQNLEILGRIKRLTIAALVADEMLMRVLVLKGGNAIDIAYDMSFRGSMDIDFSMERDFTEVEKNKLIAEIKYHLEKEFLKENLCVFDIKFEERPSNIKEEVKSFWGGYLLKFKVIEKSKFDLHKENIESLRRNAIAVHPDNSTLFTVDISKFEYVAQKKPKDIEGAVVYVYSPEMLAIEKLRALCQQVPDYKKIILSMSSKSRARDFYDIYNLTKTFTIDYASSDNIELCKNIFDAKHVPLEFIRLIPDQREFHRQSWESVINTVNQKESLKEFDFYFDFVVDIFGKLF